MSKNYNMYNGLSNASKIVLRKGVGFFLDPRFTKRVID